MGLKETDYGRERWMRVRVSLLSIVAAFAAAVML